jgi:hypothetical protein
LVAFVAIVSEEEEELLVVAALENEKTSKVTVADILCAFELVYFSL